MTNNSIKRFDRTVENYVKYRPSYPQAVVEFLHTACGLDATALVADVASGTGLLAEVFLKAGHKVIGVEPNTGMREAGIQFLQPYPHFTSIAATAEATTLDDHSVDLISVGQAFHWFEPEAARREFLRILRPGGWVALVWNIPRTDTAFMQAYNQRIWYQYLEPQTAEAKTDGQPIEEGLRQWFSPGIARFQSFENSQVVDFAGLRGRVLSSSYCPTPEDPAYQPMQAELEAVFQLHQTDNRVAIAYECRICFGQLQ